MTVVLGISAFYHDSAAALIRDGEIVAAAQEERFTRKKHDEEMPSRAIEFCLNQAGIAAADVDYVAFYDKPLLKFERLLETYLAYSPRGFDSFRKAMAVWLPKKLHTRRELERGLGKAYRQRRPRRRIVFTEHHQSHAASAFFPSPFEEAAILTLDGVGEWATASIGTGKGSRLTLRQEMHFPHSIGLLYSAFTYFCGFKVNSGEYKLMGLAPYGEPRYADLILERLIDLKDDGSFRMEQEYFDYCAGLTMTGPRFAELFGGPARRPESPITQREMDIAASIQVVTEEIVLRMARHVHALTGQRNLCLAGGVALNCVANGRLVREGPFEQVWVQPAAGDAGGALGAALFVWHQLLDGERAPRARDTQRGSFLGPRFSAPEIERFLTAGAIPHRRFTSEAELLDRTSELLAGGKVVGWFQGPMEFGPRALGARSILGDPRDLEMQATMNLKIKFRESFRPFAPSVLRSRVHEYFETRVEEDEPYMLVVAPVHPSKRLAVVEGDGLTGFERRKLARSVIPAVTHVDGSARVQTVDEERNPRYARLIEAFEKRTGCPVLINTSFNVRGEPIVCSPEDAYRCFLATEMDALVLEDFVLLKEISRLPRAPLLPGTNDRSTSTERHVDHGPPMIPVNRNPTRSQLRTFAALVFPLFWGWIAFLVYRRAEAPRVAIAIAAVAAVISIVGLISPAFMRRVWIAMMVGLSPIGWVMSHLILAFIYYLVLTPVGLALRLAGRDPLHRRLDRAAKTYWIDRGDEPAVDRYFRQF